MAELDELLRRAAEDRGLDPDLAVKGLAPDAGTPPEVLKVLAEVLKRLDDATNKK